MSSTKPETHQWGGSRYSVPRPPGYLHMFRAKLGREDTSPDEICGNRGKDVVFPSTYKIKPLSSWSFDQHLLLIQKTHFTLGLGPEFKCTLLQYSSTLCIPPVLELILFMGCWFPLIILLTFSAYESADCRHLWSQESCQQLLTCFPSSAEGTQIPAQSTWSKPTGALVKRRRGQLFLGRTWGTWGCRGEAPVQPQLSYPLSIHNAAPAATCAPSDLPCTPLPHSHGCAHAVPTT